VVGRERRNNRLHIEGNLYLKVDPKVCFQNFTLTAGLRALELTVVENPATIGQSILQRRKPLHTIPVWGNR